MNETTPLPLTISRKSLDDPKHPLRMKPSIQRKPKKIDRVKLEVEKSNENFSLIEKMREEIESIVGPDLINSPNRSSFIHQSFTPISPLGESGGHEEEQQQRYSNKTTSRQQQNRSQFASTRNAKRNDFQQYDDDDGDDNLLTYLRSNRQQINGIESDDHTITTEVSALTQTMSPQHAIPLQFTPNDTNHHHHHHQLYNVYQQEEIKNNGGDMTSYQGIASKKRQRPRSKEVNHTKSTKVINNRKMIGNNISENPTHIPVLPAFFEGETFRREQNQAKNKIELEKQQAKRSKQRKQSSMARSDLRAKNENKINVAISSKDFHNSSSFIDFKKQEDGESKKRNEESSVESSINVGVMKSSLKPISAKPISILEGGSSGPGFYGVSFKRNPRRVPQSALDFWSRHKEQAPIINSKGLGALSFDLPYLKSETEKQTQRSQQQQYNHHQDSGIYGYLSSNPSTSSSMSQVVSMLVSSQESNKEKLDDDQNNNSSSIKKNNAHEEARAMTTAADTRQDMMKDSGGSMTRRARTAGSMSPNESRPSFLSYPNHVEQGSKSRTTSAYSTHHDDDDDDELSSFVISLGSNPTTPITNSYKRLQSRTTTQRQGLSSLNSHREFDPRIEEAELTGVDVGDDRGRGGGRRLFEDMEESHNLWEDQFRSPLARSLAPSMLYLTYNATNTAHIQVPHPIITPSTIEESNGKANSKEEGGEEEGEEGSTIKTDEYKEEDVGEELARVMLQSEAAIVGGPDFEHVLLAAAAYRNKSPKTELAEIDLARKAIERGRLKHLGIQNPYQISCQLFAWSAESHQAAWVLQRFIRKRQIRRNICQIILKNAYFSYVERREFFKAVQNAKKVSGQLMPILRIYFLKIKKKVKNQRKAAIFLQSNIRRWKAIKRTEFLKKQRYLNAAMLLTQTFRARLRYLRRKKRRDKIQLSMTLKLQAWIRGRIARKEFKCMELCQKWFASIWRQFYAKKYGNAVYRIQIFGRRFLLGLKARKIQCMGRIWLARRRAKEKVIQATLAENIRYQGEHLYVNKGVRRALDDLVAIFEGNGANNGISDKESGKLAKKKLDQILRMREKTIQARHKAAIHANEAEYKISLKKLKSDGVLPDNKAKLRKEIRSLLYLAHQPLQQISSNKKKGNIYKKGATTTTNDNTTKSNLARKKLNKENNDADEDDVIAFDEKSNFGSLFCFYDGPMRSKPPPLSSHKMFNQSQLSRHKRQNLFYEESVKNMQRALKGEGYRKKVGCCDIHFLRILLASFGCYDVSEEELLFIMHKFDPTDKELLLVSPPIEKGKDISIPSQSTTIGSSSSVQSISSSNKNNNNNNHQPSSKSGLFTIFPQKEKSTFTATQEGQVIHENNELMAAENEIDEDGKLKKKGGGFFSGFNQLFVKKKTNKEDISKETLFPISFQSNVNARGYVANDERLILGLSLLIHKHLYGENRPKGISGSAVGVTRQLQAAWGKVGRSVPVLESSIGSLVSKSLLPQSMLYVDVARYEHLRMITDSSFVKSTEHYRIRYPAKWSCPLCLAAFPTWGMMNRHVKHKNCIRRAPVFNRENDSSQDIWNLLTEKRVGGLKVNYFAKLKLNETRKVGILSTSSSRGMSTDTNLNTLKSNHSSSGGGGGDVNTAAASSELSETSTALVTEIAHLGGYWDPSGGLNKKGRDYASGIPPPEVQILSL